MSILRYSATLILSTTALFAADPLFDGMKAELLRGQTLALGQLVRGLRRPHSLGHRAHLVIS